MDESKNNLRGQVEEINSCIQKFLGDLTTTLSNFGDHISSLSSTAEGINPIKAKLSDIMHDISDGRNEVEALFKSLIGTIGKNHEEETVQLNIFQSGVNESRQKMEYLVLQQLDAMQNIRSMWTEKIDSFTTMIAADKKQCIEQLKTLVNFIEEQEKERLAEEKEEAEYINQMENVLSQLRAKQASKSKKLASRVKNTTKYANEMVTKMNELEDAEKAAMNEAVQVINTEQDKVSKSVESYDQVSSQISTALIRQTMDLIEKREDAYNESIEQINKINHFVTDAFTRAEKGDEELSAMVETHSTTLTSQVAEADKDINGKLKVGISTVEGLHTSADHLAHSLNENIDEIKKRAQVNENSQIRQIDSIRTSFTKFIECDLVDDVPTGQTPQRCPFEYPRDLAHTSPHDTILSRFRAAMQPANESIMEDVEVPQAESNGVESNVSSCSSSQLSLNANNENSAPSECNPSENDSGAGAGDPSMNMKNITRTLFKDKESSEETLTVKSTPANKPKSNQIKSSSTKSSNLKPLKTANK